MPLPQEESRATEDMQVEDGNRDQKCGKEAAHPEPTGLTWGEVRNMVLLGIIFSIYFGFRSGSLVVLPLACKELLRDELHGEDYSPLYSLPLMTWFAMDIVLATPNAYIMRTCGRRPAFAFAGCAGLVGSIGAFCALTFTARSLHSFILLNVCVMVMSEVGMAEFVRFAVAEACSSKAKRPRMVSKVMGFGACASMIGPFSASFAESLVPQSGGVLEGIAYFFLCTAALSIVMIAASLCLRLPALPDSASEKAAPLCQILRRTPVWSSIVAQVTVQFAMAVPMSTVPLAMMAHIPSLRPADVKISGCIVLHVLSMFIPGFWTGDLIGIVGSERVMAVGLLLQGSGMLVGLSGTHLYQFYVSLALIGFGWNLAFVAGTLLLIRSHSSAERTKVTSANETLRFAANGIAVLLSSSMQWDALMFISLFCLLPAACVTMQEQRKTASV